MMNYIQHIVVFLAAVAVSLLSLNAQAQSCYTTYGAVAHQPSDPSGGDLFDDGWQIDFSLGSSGGHIEDTLDVDTLNEETDNWIIVDLDCNIVETALANSNGTCDSSVRKVCVQGGACIYVDTVIDGETLSYTIDDYSAEAYVDNSPVGSISETSSNTNISGLQSGVLTLDHKKVDGVFYYWQWSYTNPWVCTLGSACVEDHPVDQWYADDNGSHAPIDGIDGAGTAVHMDVGSVFNQASVTAQSSWNPHIYVANRGYEQAFAHQVIRVRASVSDVSSGGTCP
ncbi:MAG: hypothetical protein GC154_11190 [bacterium]|nr:hypothetical protein [bacterium]